MREIRLSGLEGGGAGNRSPYPYPESKGVFRDLHADLQNYAKTRSRSPIGELACSEPGKLGRFQISHSERFDKSHDHNGLQK